MEGQARHGLGRLPIPHGPGTGALIAERYRPLRMLGRGAMGVVHEAEDTRLGRRVAVKMLTAVEGLARDDVTLERFLREARALARIDHPGVVTLYDSGVHGTTPYLVMQLLDGVSLARLVSETGPLPAPVVSSVGLGIAEALAAAHEAGVLHRDVKPSNVGLTRDGRVVLQDFGLARLAGEAVITRTGVVGTPQFMAPEAMRGVLPAPSADWYGLGACMYLMITGEVPFVTAVEIGAIVEQALDDGVPSLRGRLPSYPEELTRLVDALCRQDPAERPQQVDVVRSVLGELADDGTEALVALLVRREREQAVQGVSLPAGHVAEEAPEYEWSEEHAVPGPRHQGVPSPATLSDATRRIVLSTMTAQNALSRQREAVNLVLRGQFREAAEMLSMVVPACLARLGPEHPTTLTSQYWQAVCLARLGAGGEALELFSRVNKRVGRRTDGNDD